MFSSSALSWRALSEAICIRFLITGLLKAEDPRSVLELEQNHPNNGAVFILAHDRFRVRNQIQIRPWIETPRWFGKGLPVAQCGIALGGANGWAQQEA